MKNPSLQKKPRGNAETKKDIRSTDITDEIDHPNATAIVTAIATVGRTIVTRKKTTTAIDISDRVTLKMMSVTTDANIIKMTIAIRTDEIAT